MRISEKKIQPTFVEYADLAEGDTFYTTGMKVENPSSEDLDDSINLMLEDGGIVDLTNNVYYPPDYGDGEALKEWSYVLVDVELLVE